MKKQQVSGAEFAVETTPTKERWVMASVLLLTLLVAYVDRVNVSILMADNSFLTEMGIKGDPVSMGLLMSTFLAAYGLANVLLSPVGDILGPRKAMGLSIFLWSVALLFGGMASTFALLLSGRVLLGIGEAMHWPMQSKYVKNWFPPGERGKANSIWIFGIFIGPALAMPFFTWVIQGMGWRMSFFILSLIGLIPLALIWFLTSDYPRGNKRVNKLELDYIEMGLKAETDAENQIQKTGIWENMKLFIFNYRFWLLTIFYFCNASVWWGTMAWLPSYLKMARGFSWATMGGISSLPYVLGAIAVAIFGYLSDRVGRRAPFAAISMFGAALGIYFGAYAPDNVTAAILISLGIAALGLGLPSTWSLLQQVVPGKSVGAGAGMMNGIANGGAALAPIVIGWLIANNGGSYIAGLMYLVTMGVLGGICMCILSYQKY